jgi:hypothetical protein
LKHRSGEVMVPINFWAPTFDPHGNCNV